MARIYRGFATGESDVGKFSRKSYINFVDSSHGAGFIDSVGSIFPELKRLGGLFDKMHLALNVPLTEALRTIERTALDLAQLCKCSCCTPSGAESETSCLLAIVFAIRELVSTISCTVMDENILTNISGIRGSYVRAYYHLIMSKGHGDDELPLLAIAAGLPMEGMGGNVSYYRHDKSDLLSRPMEFFSGYSKHDRYYPENNRIEKQFCTATVRRGLCYYLDCLRSLSSIVENARIVHIVPGHIQMGDRQFDSTYDPGEMERVRSPIKFDIIEKFDSGDTLEQLRRGNLKAEPRGVEKMTKHELVVFYKVLIPNEPPLNLTLCYISR